MTAQFERGCFGFSSISSGRLFGVQHDDAVTLRIVDVVGEDVRPVARSAARLQALAQVLAVKDVVAEDQADRSSPRNVFADQERLRQTAGVRLLGVLELAGPIATRRPADGETTAGRAAC